MDAAAAAEQAAGRRVSVEPDGKNDAYDLLTVTYVTPDGSTPSEWLTDNWALLGNMLQKSVWAAPKIAAEMVKIESGRVRGELRTKMEALARGNSKWVAVDGTTEDLKESDFLDWCAAQGTGVSRAVFEQLLLDMGQGAETYQMAQFVLRHQYSFVNGALIKDPYVYANKIMTTEVLKVVEAFPATLPFDLPAGVWLKQCPSVQPLGGNKYQIEEEWWHADDYARSLHDLVTV